MLKKLLIIGVCIIILISGALIFALSQANSLLNGSRDKIESAISNATGLEVKLGELRISIFPKTSFSSSESSIKTLGSNSAGIKLASLQASVDLIPLLSKQIAIKEFTLNEPNIIFNKTKDGVSIEGLEFKKKAPAQIQATKTLPKTQQKTTKNSSQPALSINLESFAINNAQITFNDKLAKKSYEIKPLNFTTALKIDGNDLKLQNVTANGKLNSLPIELNLPAINLKLSDKSFSDAAYQIIFSKINLGGTLSANLNKGDANLQISSLFLPLGNLEELASKFLPNPLPMKLAGEIKGNASLVLKAFTPASQSKLNLTLNDVSASKPGLDLKKLAGELQIIGNLEQLNVKSANPLTFNLNGIDGQSKLDTSVKLNELIQDNSSLEIFGGSILSQTKLAQKNNFLNSDIEIKNLDLEQAAKTLAPKLPIAIQGKISTSAKNISANLKNPAESIRTDLQGNVADGRILDVNIAKLVAQSVQGVPFLSKSLLEILPQETDPLMQAKDTEFRKLAYRGLVQNQNLQLESFELTSDLFELSADGNISFQKKVNLNAELLFIPSISAGIVSKVKELKPLLDSSGRLAIPVKLTGTLPKITALPDLKKITSRAIEEKAKEKVADFLGKALGGDKDSSRKNPLGNLLGSN